MAEGSGARSWRPDYNKSSPVKFCFAKNLRTSVLRDRVRFAKSGKTHPAARGGEVDGQSLDRLAKSMCLRYSEEKFGFRPNWSELPTSERSLWRQVARVALNKIAAFERPNSMVRDQSGERSVSVFRRKKSL